MFCFLNYRTKRLGSRYDELHGQRHWVQIDFFANAACYNAMVDNEPRRFSSRSNFSERLGEINPTTCS